MPESSRSAVAAVVPRMGVGGEVPRGAGAVAPSSDGRQLLG